VGNIDILYETALRNLKTKKREKKTIYLFLSWMQESKKLIAIRNTHCLDQSVKEYLRHLRIVLNCFVEATVIRLYNFIYDILNNIALLLQNLGFSFTIFRG
jgi:hypothetical protein